MLGCRVSLAIRFLSRASLRETMASVRGPSRSTSMSKLQQRLADFEKESAEGAVDGKTSRFSVDSMMGEKLIQSDIKYEAILSRRVLEERQKEPAVTEMLSPSNEVAFPLMGSKVDANPVNIGAQVTESEPEIGDRGFYVEAGQYVDEYISGSTCELPEDSMNTPTRLVFGGKDAVEHIDFQLPGQRTGEHEPPGQPGGANEDELKWSEQFGTTDAARPASHEKCGGCGAQMHCKDSSLPGFLPVELFEKMESDASSILCRRCHLLKNHDFLLNVNVCPVDYASMLSHLRTKNEALVILVVDVTDIPGSVHRHLPDIIGSQKPMIVVGNKVDLLPPDARCGYLKRFRTVVQEAIEKAGFRDKFNILHTSLVSAKTGYGIEELITEIHLKWTNVKSSMRSDMYLVGCTNAGKSTLFNSLLQSDLCKVRAVDLVERATASVWPGTTISLLKFPVMKPSPYRLEMRRRRLLQHRAWKQKEMYARKRLLQDTGDSSYAVLSDMIQNTYKDQEEELQPVAIRDVLSQAEHENTPQKRTWNEDDPVFARGTWCFDTPGTVNEEQVTSLFTLDELVRVLPRSLLMPRTALVSPGNSLIIGGVARIDVEPTTANPVYLTTFVSDDLPLFVVNSADVDGFYSKFGKTDRLVVPRGNRDRMDKWPGLGSRELVVRGAKDEGCSDVVLSSIGWVMVTSSSESRIRLTAWTPAAKGITVRAPILPHAASLRGKRVPGTQFYKVKPVEFPVNSRRIRAVKNKKNKRNV